MPSGRFPARSAAPTIPGVTQFPSPSGRVFRRAPGADPLVAVRGAGSTLWDASGRAYLDAAGGAIVVNVGHGRASIAAAMAEQAGRLAYAHGSAFTTQPLEDYAAEVGPRLPVRDPAIYPVSGGSEAMETALKLVRAYHLARGDDRRWIVFSRWGSYHGNTLGALDLSGRKPLRRPYEAWLGRFRHLSAPYAYRAEDPNANALGDTRELIRELERAIEASEPDTVAAFVGEPIVGATLGGAVPPDDYWPAVAEVCRRHGILLVADEVMTGFGRTGTWFAMDRWHVRPDILVAAKGATSGYWPLGFVAASGEVYDAVTSAGPFVHGFTYSHNPVGAAVAREVLRILDDEGLVKASAAKGERLQTLLRDALGGQAGVGDIRGAGLLVGIELVADAETRRPFPRAAGVTEAVVRAARDRGVIVYSSTGCADGVDGDLIVLGPPFVVTDAELAQIADTLRDSTAEAVAAVSSAAV
jgi:adenosylmethionine-8-amino-7-oxononanoate aminotransferase